jgi:hypothetical protein
MYGWHRAMRLFDGPDEVHLRSIAKAELRRMPALPPRQDVGATVPGSGPLESSA